ncbi:MAG: response regulator, partial [Desulfobacterales bacterium]
MALKVLVVEDDVDFSKNLMEFLNESGFKTMSVNSAEEAEEVLKKKEINLVLTDIKLPGMDGIKLAKNIKKKYNLGVI